MVSTQGCFGSFKLVRGLWKFNKEASSSKWIQWLVFLGLAIIPVYTIAALGDALIFNSIEFWGAEDGTIEAPAANADAPRERWVQLSDDERLHLRKSDDGQMLHAEVFRNDESIAAFSFERTESGMALRDQDGTVRGYVRSMPEGGLVLVDATTGKISSFTAEEVSQRMEDYSGYSEVLSL